VHPPVEAPPEPTQVDWSPAPPPVEPPPEQPQADWPPEPPAATRERADDAISLERPGADSSSGHGSQAAPGAAQDGEQRTHATILLTADEVASVPDSAIARPARHVHIEPELRKRTSGKAIVALVFAVVGTPLLGILLGWFAILFAALAKREMRANPALNGRSLATTALLLGIFDILLWAALIAVYWRMPLHHTTPPVHSRTPNVLSLFVMGIHP
jgi:hypothetical protein